MDCWDRMAGRQNQEREEEARKREWRRHWERVEKGALRAEQEAAQLKLKDKPRKYACYF